MIRNTVLVVCHFLQESSTISVEVIQMPMPVLSIESTDFIELSKPLVSLISQMDITDRFPYSADFTSRNVGVYVAPFNKRWLRAKLPDIRVSTMGGSEGQTTPLTVKVTADTNYVAKIKYSDLSDTDILSIGTEVKLFYGIGPMGMGMAAPVNPPSDSFDMLNSPSGVMTNVNEQSVVLNIPVRTGLWVSMVQGWIYIAYTPRPVKEIEEQNWRCTVL